MFDNSALMAALGGNSILSPGDPGDPRVRGGPMEPKVRPVHGGPDGQPHESGFGGFLPNMANNPYLAKFTDQLGQFGNTPFFGNFSDRMNDSRFDGTLIGALRGMSIGDVVNGGFRDALQTRRAERRDDNQTSRGATRLQPGFPVQAPVTTAPAAPTAPQPIAPVNRVGSSYGVQDMWNPSSQFGLPRY